MTIAGLACAAGGLLAAATIRNPQARQRLGRPHLRTYHCALDATPLRAAPLRTTGTTEARAA